jgi:putative membrane-bound dehydrogenase-like protein
MTARQLTVTGWNALAWSLFVSSIVCAAEPRVIDNRYKLELIASDPQIVTPIGLVFDRKGRMLVIESHTHQRPQGYKGPSGDRIRMFADSDGDGRLDRWSTFAEGFRFAMNLLVRDHGGVYVATRHGVVLLRDMDNDGVAEKQDEILRLETKDDYPHNGLSGIALQPDGSTLLLGLGENHGLPYRLVGTDGTVLTGKDGAGSIFQCALDGHDLQRVATGFWNPFSLCVVPDGRIFAVDNDPDSMPSCRLLQIVWDGDYGFKYQYGRAGNHPLQAWNGELPGTLPMICGVGEAPTTVLPYGGALWVASWGDHRVERYRLFPRGISYGAQRDVIVQGGADFRPTGMAIAPDGSLYIGDWVLKDYPVHGRGRIWRLTAPKGEATVSLPKATAKSYADIPLDFDASEKLLNSDDPFERTLGAAGRSRGKDPQIGHGDQTRSARARLGTLQAMRTMAGSVDHKILAEALRDPSPDVRSYAVRWIADERMMDLRDDVAKLLEGPQASSQYYLGVVGAIDWLDHEPTMHGVGIADALLMLELESDRRTPEAHALALSMMAPDHRYLTARRMKIWLASPSAALRLEAIRTLAMQSNPKRFSLLAEVAQDDSQSDEVRAEAIVGLSSAAGENRELLEKMATSDHALLRREAERALRLAGMRPATADARPPVADLAGWKEKVRGPGDAAAGRRLFFSPVGPRCSVCHKYGGRGGNVGPDLTQISRSASREKIITSILQPSQEIAPDYQAWTLVDRNGKTYTGLRLPKAGDNGQEDYADEAGKVFTLFSSAIEDRRVSSTSIMPDNLQSMLSTDDLRDLVTFLAGGQPSSSAATK